MQNTNISSLSDSGITKSLALVCDSNFFKINSIRGRLDRLWRQLRLHPESHQLLMYNYLNEIEDSLRSARLAGIYKYYLINNTLYSYYSLNYVTIENHWKTVSGLDWIPFITSVKKPVKKYLHTMKLNMAQSRRSELMWRLKSELRETTFSGWFVIMNTLTVRNEDFLKVFSRGSKSFIYYIKAIDKAVGGSDNHSYFAVTEEGSTTGRLHIHVIHMLKQLPVKCADPNRANPDRPLRRNIEAFRKFWSFGFSAPIAVRFDAKDAYSLLGWLWPVIANEAGSYVPIKAGSCDRVASYLGKYLIKTYIKEEKSLWRTKIRRGLGERLILKALYKLTDEQLSQILLIADSRQLLIHREKLPLNYLKKLTARVLLNRNPDPISRLKLLMELPSLPSIIERLSAQMRTLSIPSSTSTMSLKTKNLKDMDFSKIIAVFEAVFLDSKPSTFSQLLPAGSSYRR